MSVLFMEAFEEVRVVSAQLREESQATRAQASALRVHSADLLAQSAVAMKRLAQFLPPPPEAIRQAESQMLEIFKNGPGRKDEREQESGQITGVIHAPRKKYGQSTAS